MYPLYERPRLSSGFFPSGSHTKAGLMAINGKRARNEDDLASIRTRVRANFWALRRGPGAAAAGPSLDTSGLGAC
jgi:hypothetical protein